MRVHAAARRGLLGYYEAVAGVLRSVVQVLLLDPLHPPAYRKGHTNSSHLVIFALFVLKYCKRREVDVKIVRKFQAAENKENTKSRETLCRLK